MALQSFTYVPAQITATKLAGLAAVTSSAEQVFGKDAIIAINADQDITIKFGVTGMGAAAATDFRIPINQTMVFELGSSFTAIRVFNLHATLAANVYIQPLARF